MPETTATTAKEVVMGFLNAMNHFNYSAAREYVAGNLIFRGVMGTRDGADVYFEDMEKMRFRYHIKKIIAEDNDVSVLYDIEMQGHTIPTSGWYEVEDGKISIIRVLFDPRPLLDPKR